MKRIIPLSLALGSTLFGAGYQIPNNSVNSNALATAYVANAHGADTSYYNPANMVYNTNKNEVEVSLMYIYLPSQDYNPVQGFNIQSRRQDAVIPSLHYASPKLSDSGIRIGFSIIAPYGLSREWDNQPALATAKKFELEVIEYNPTIAIPITNNFSIGVGLRYLRADGQVKIDGNPYVPYTVNMNGKDDRFAYNIALSYKPTSELSLAATYRSGVTLNTIGMASIVYGSYATYTGASTQVELPDNVALGVAYNINKKTTIEFTFDTTLWSNIKKQDFDYMDPIINASALSARKDKKWKDSYSYRFGVTHNFDALTLMGGIAYSTNASDGEYVSFSSPEADSMTYSLGGRYDLNNDFNIGFSILYADYKDRTVIQPTNPLGVNGRFSDKAAIAVNTSINYKF
jgi:long-chain fatty acid transport protein